MGYPKNPIIPAEYPYRCIACLKTGLGVTKKMKPPTEAAPQNGWCRHLSQALGTSAGVRGLRRRLSRNSPQCPMFLLKAVDIQIRKLSQSNQTTRGQNRPVPKGDNPCLL